MKNEKDEKNKKEKDEKEKDEKEKDEKEKDEKEKDEKEKDEKEKDEKEIEKRPQILFLFPREKNKENIQSNNVDSEDDDDSDDDDDKYDNDNDDDGEKNITTPESPPFFFNPLLIPSPYNFKKKHDQKKQGQPKKSDQFEVIQNTDTTFKDVGGYETVKEELHQCVDILVNHQHYAQFNVRTPKGLILEGPPGTGKTLLAKAFAGETKTAFIPVSGSQFQGMYVGVGAGRVRELFDLARKNVPCVVFVDEIDAVGRKRSTDGEASSSERDSTLNEFLIQLDGFKSSLGIFLMGATNRLDLLDPALVRPGRIDKKIFIGPPDSNTREAILDIHLRGKPHDKSILIKDLVDLTAGFSGAKIENLLNEAMLHALRQKRVVMEHRDLEAIMNKIMVGWQPNEHQFSTDIIDRIAIHEMGHAIVGFLSVHHSKVSKVIINLFSPNNPGYTMFETSTSSIYKREYLFEHLTILLAGRIAEEAFYGVSTTTGAINDLEEALKLSEKMIRYYGMGKRIIYPTTSEKYKEMGDDEVLTLINDAYAMANFLVRNSKDLIRECADILKKEKILKMDTLTKIIHSHYPHVLELKMEN